MSEWNFDMDAAPRTGEIVDLLIEGEDDTVDFYSATAHKVKGKPLRRGRSTDWRWAHKPPNAPNWYPVHGIGYPLSPEVRPIAWMPIPPLPPPRQHERRKHERDQRGMVLNQHAAFIGGSTAAPMAAQRDGPMSRREPNCSLHRGRGACHLEWSSSAQ